MSSLRAFAAPLALAVLLVAPAEATTSYYQGASAEAAFNSAVGGLTLLDPALTFSSTDLGSGGLFNASGTGIDFLGYNDLNASGINFTVSSGQLTATEGDQRVHVTFPVSPQIYAFAFHITFVSGSASYGNWCMGLTLGSCDYNVINSNASDVQFFGIVSDTPITSTLYIQAATQTPKIVFTNFEAFTGAEAPEPHTMLLVGLGLILVPLLRRRLQQSS